MNFDSKLDSWIKTNKNVLLIGKKGCGKTARAIESLIRNNIKYKYFSAPTLDPWVDFVGIPKELKSEDLRIIEFIKPSWHNEDIECIIIDEYNRGQSKVRSACMELIQFKSINGVKFPNLKMVWAMINETDDEEDYNVDSLDPAEKDRFHVHYSVKYEPDREYFNKKYNENGDKSVNWWNEQPKIVKNMISPRRLDYALEFFLDGGDMHDILPMECNPFKLQTILKMQDINKILDDLRLSTKEEIKKWFLDPNNLDVSIKTILNNNVYLREFIYFIPMETLSQLICTDAHVQDVVVKDYMDNDMATQVLDEIIKSNTNTNVVKTLSKKTSAIRLAKQPLKFSKTVSFISFNGPENNCKFEEWLDIIRNKNGKSYYSSTQKTENINCVESYLSGDVAELEKALNEIEIVASTTSDSVFNNTHKWINLLNSFLKLQNNMNTNKGTQFFLKKKYPYIFSKILRLRLEELVLEIKNGV